MYPPQRIHMITELHAGGTLRKWHSHITRNQNPILPDRDMIFQGHLAKELKTVAVAISQALRYLHKTKIIHRDVRPDNIFVRLEERSGSIEDAVLADLGLFCFAGEAAFGFGEGQQSGGAGSAAGKELTQAVLFDRTRGLAGNAIEELLKDGHTISGNPMYWPPEVVAQFMDERFVKNAMDMR